MFDGHAIELEEPLKVAYCEETCYLGQQVALEDAEQCVPALQIINAFPCSLCLYGVMLNLPGLDRSIRTCTYDGILI